MMHLRRPNAPDQKRLKRLESKEYRDSYLSSQVRTWIAYQFLALRNKFGFTQSAMAERTSKTQSVISRLESSEYGKVSVQTLLDVASSLDVALLVQFVSYPEFLDRTRDKSEDAMQPDTIFESNAANDLAIASAMAQSAMSLPAQRTTAPYRQSALANSPMLDMQSCRASQQQDWSTWTTRRSHRKLALDPSVLVQQ